MSYMPEELDGTINLASYIKATVKMGCEGRMFELSKQLQKDTALIEQRIGLVEEALETKIKRQNNDERDERDIGQE